MSRWLKVALVVLLALAVSPGTTSACATATYEAPVNVGLDVRALATCQISASVRTASAASFAYDVSTIARVDGYHVSGADPAEMQLTAALELSTPASAEAISTSTTPVPSVVATEAADPNTQLSLWLMPTAANSAAWYAFQPWACQTFCV